jgi:hypothetical protein
MSVSATAVISKGHGTRNRAITNPIRQYAMSLAVGKDFIYTDDEYRATITPRKHKDGTEGVARSTVANGVQFGDSFRTVRNPLVKNADGTETQYNNAWYVIREK